MMLVRWPEMTQKKPDGGKYSSRTISIRPDQAEAIVAWPRGQFSRVCQAAIDQEIARRRAE